MEQRLRASAGFTPPPSPLPSITIYVPRVAKRRAGTHQETEERAVSGVKVSAGSVWMGKHCLFMVLSLVSGEKMLAGSVVKPFDCALHATPL